MKIETHYQKLVRQGRETLKEIERLEKKIVGYQQKIAMWAVEVCDIRHGGRSNGLYTIKDYARDIGMNAKTLQNWVQIYRNVVMKLDKPRANWQAASKTNDILRQENVMKNKKDGTPRRKGCKRFVPKERVQEIYERAINEKPFISEFHSAVAQAKHIKFLMKNRDLGIIDDYKLTHLMEELDTASEIINQFLTEKARANRYRKGVA